MLAFLAALCMIVLAADKSINACLYEFYLSTDGPNWYSSEGWDVLADESGDYCLAYGVECDIDSELLSISMPMNNLVGEIPACFANLHTLKELSIQSNYVSGSMENLPSNLVKLSLSMTSFTNITPDICHLSSLNTFSMSYCELTNVTLPLCLYNVPSISIMNSGVRLPEELTSLDIEVGRKGLSIPGTDASRLVFNIPADEMRGLSALDLSGTGVSGSFNLSQLIFAFPRVQDLYLGGNNFTGWIDFSAFSEPIPASVLRTSTINLGSNGFKGILNGITEVSVLLGSFWSDLYGIDLSNNKLIGISPTSEELQLLFLKHKDFYILNLENNIFLCSEERTSLFNCIDLHITNIMVHTAPVRSVMDGININASTNPLELDIKVQIDILLPGKVPKDLATEFVNNLGLLLVPSEDSAASEVASLILLNISYNKTQDNTLLTTSTSTPLNGVDTKNIPQFKLIWPNMNLTLKVRLQLSNESVTEVHQVSTMHEEGSAISFFDSNDSDDNSTISKMTLDVYGMSRCPYFSQLMVNEIRYLVDTYPMATTVLNIQYVSLSKPSVYTVSGGYSSHGAAEVTGDYYFLCLQNYTNLNATIMRDYYLCMYGNKSSVSGIPYNITRCNAKILRQQYKFTDVDIKKVTDCSQSRANTLITESFSHVLANKVGFSPTLYLENELFCLGGVKCLYDDSSYDLEIRVANLVDTACSIYREKYGEYPNCTQKLAAASQCPFNEIIVGSTCILQKSIVITVSVCCMTFLLLLVMSLILYSIIKERQAKNKSHRGVHKDKIDALLTDNNGSISDPDLI
ncbi:Leucine-rich repeat protein [Giardia lamblia P15]|uniref:Leucine-rich repeat protein n=1 Tax=Giardia intestinalis (strain P15) TaxID=658858 RepID=E1F722_GIAIA|nr:Leucine-rich repeat protein [Giardia lamblia P15]